MTRAARLLDPALHLPDLYERLYAAWGPQHWWPGDTPFEVMVGAILTQNCNWANVEKAIGNLKRAGLLEANALYAAPREQVAGLIRPTGYFNIKAMRLAHFLRFYVEACEGSPGFKGMALPLLRERLLAVNGLGKETADSILLYALGRRVFVVDAYTRRILKRHFLTRGDEEYDTVRMLFEDHLPRRIRLYNEYHALIVHAGKDHCKPCARCVGCPLAGHPHDAAL